MSTTLAAGHVLIGANVSPALRGMAQVDSAFRATGSKIGKTGSLITKAIGLPVAAAFAYSIKAAADFESALNNMQAVSGATNAQMKRVGATAKALGADVKLPGTSAKDAADAMVELAKGGLTADQAMKAARGTLLLSAAAGIDNAQAATIQARALNSFGLAAKSAGHVSDLLAASANASTSEITDMALSLSQSAAVAHQANYSIDDTVTALGLLANAGIIGADAGTSLKTMLLRLQAPMGAGAKAVKALGLNLRDSSGELKKMPALAQEFTNKTKGLTKAQRDAAFAAIFGTDAIRAANVLLGQGSGAFDKMKAKVTEAGAAQKLAAAKMKGFNGALEAFKSSAQTAAISVGQVLLPAATSLVQKATALAGAFENLTPAQQRMAMQFAAIAAAAGPALVILSKFQGVSSSLPLGLARLGGPLGIMVVSLAALALSSDSSRASLTQMGAALAPIGEAIAKVVSSPIVLWMAAAGAGALGLVRAFTAARVALAALTAATAASPMGALVVGAGLALGAIIGLTSALGGGTSAMQRFREATDAAKAALDRVKDGALGARGANLAHQSALLEVKAAQQGLAQVQKQVTSGEIAGKDASLALAQARLRVKQANLGVATSSQSLSGAIKKERSDLVSYNMETHKAIVAAQQRVDQARAAILVMGGSAARTNELRSAEMDLASAMKSAGQATGATTGQIAKAAKGAQAGTTATKGLRSQMDSLKSKALSVTVDTAGAMFKLVQLVGLMAQVASKTVNVSVNTTVTKKSANEVGLRLTKVVRDAIYAAKGNAVDLASGLAGMIGSGVDALAGRDTAALNNGPEAQRIRQIEAEQQAAQDAREKSRLEQAVTDAQTNAERQDAQTALDDWFLEQERRTLAEQLAQKQQAIQDEADSRKTAAERGLADLTDQFNRGLIKQDAYNQGVQALLSSSVGNYSDLGGLLGSAFVSGFGAQIAALTQQISAIAGGPQAGGGLGPDVVNPQNVQNADQRDRLSSALQTARDKAAKGMDMLSKAKAALSKSKSDAVAKGSPGGTSITSAEQAEIDKGQDAVAGAQRTADILNRNAATAQTALQNWNAAHHARFGGIIGGAGVADRVPILAAPGEGILSARGMDNLMEMAMGGGSGGSGGGSSLTVNIYDRTTTGMSRDQARRLADQIAPELQRRVSMRA